MAKKTPTATSTITAGVHGVKRSKPYGRITLTRRKIKPGRKYRVLDEPDGGFHIRPLRSA